MLLDISVNVKDGDHVNETDHVIEIGEGGLDRVHEIAIVAEVVRATDIVGMIVIGVTGTETIATDDIVAK
ncbi:hypothetical protein Y032_0069g327 [Ancylostoma ceylanicum]|nr:hypothetical protein Y032_0069g327 [Ancylostoma ceylanicum]